MKYVIKINIPNRNEDKPALVIVTEPLTDEKANAAFDFLQNPKAEVKVYAVQHQQMDLTTNFVHRRLLQAEVDHVEKGHEQAETRSNERSCIHRFPGENEPSTLRQYDVSRFVCESCNKKFKRIVDHLVELTGDESAGGPAHP